MFSVCLGEEEEDVFDETQHSDSFGQLCAGQSWWQLRWSLGLDSADIGRTKEKQYWLRSFKVAHL